MSDDLRKRVFDNLDACEENEYVDELRNGPSINIAHDLVAYAADMEDESVEGLVPYIDEWRRLKGFMQ